MDQDSLLSEIPEIRGLLDGRKIITAAQRLEFQRFYDRGSNRARNALVSFLLLQGLETNRLAELLGRETEEIEKQYTQAIEEIGKELDSFPEGPLLIGQVIIEGYSRLATRIHAEIERRLPAAEDKEAVNLLKLAIEATNSVTDRMDKYGMTPVVPKTGKSQGGIRPEAKAVASRKMDDALSHIAEENGIDLRALEKEVHEGVVE